MFSNKDSFKQAYVEQCHQQFAEQPHSLESIEKYLVLSQMLANEIRELWATSREKMRHSKKVHYFSSEFLIGHLLKHHLKALEVEETVREGLWDIGIDLDELISEEKDAGLGNGGLGRLAACFMDSMTHLGIAGRGNSIRYRHGFFDQIIENCEQKEVANHWLDKGYPWETYRPGLSVNVRFGGNVNIQFEDGRYVFKHENYWEVKAVPYDICITSQGNRENVNAIRLWDAQAKDDFNFQSFSDGDYIGAVSNQVNAQNLTQVLYPNDNHPQGRRLRLMQEYFFVSAGVTNILSQYKQQYGSLDGVEDKNVIHINDTHPALCIPELLRLLIDEYDIGWEIAWEKTKKMISYTNHTILPEALECWSVDIMREVLPRIYMIIEEINRRTMNELLDADKIQPYEVEGVSIIRNGQVHMAPLAVLGSHSINGVAQLHTEILKSTVMNAYYKIYPNMFNNKTNGISQRIFLQEANPQLTNLITESIGEGWKTNTYEFKKLLAYKEDSAFRDRFTQIKRQNKVALTKLIQEKCDITVDPDSIFDIQVKRIHAYKRQLLNILGIMMRCMQSDTYLEQTPAHTFIFAGKAAPGYGYAKSIIQLCGRLAERINNDPKLGQKLRVVFLPNFNVSIAQGIYPAADISQQISTAGMEASGTGNMKFMMNGAVTLGTLDGANIEIAELVGEENIKIFGMTVEQIDQLKQQGYNPWEVLSKDVELRNLLSLFQNGFFGGNAGQFNDIYDSLLKYGDTFYVLKDFYSYFQVCMDCERLYKQPEVFQKMQIHNIAMSGHFSSDRSIREYAKEIWDI